MIEIQNVRKYFRSGFLLQKKWALKGVNLTVNPGDIFALLGPNGAGKTTLLLCLIGFLDIDQGHAKLLDLEPNDIKVYSKISYLPELPTIPKHLNAVEFLKINAGLNKIKVTKSEIDEWLDKVNLLNESKKRIKKYSKGMVQRLAIAAAFMKNCDVYFLDEPILGLDPFGIKLIRDLIEEKQTQNKTIFLNSHILSEVEKTATRIAVMNEGEIILERNIGDLKNKYLKISVKGINDSDLDQFKKDYPDLDFTDNNLIFTDITEENVPRIIRQVSSRFDVYGVSFQKESIEDIFMQYVEERHA